MKVYVSPIDYDIAAANGISYNCVVQRIHRLGWDKQKAITVPTREHKLMNTAWVELANKNGIKTSTFWDRVYRSGWTHQRAATEPPKGSR